MTRPDIIRADSIDLQDHEAPSASDHSHHAKSQPTESANTFLGPHQAGTLREVAAETAEENLRSPRVSWSGPGETDDPQPYAEDLASGVAASIEGRSTSHIPSSGHTGSRMQKQDALAVAQNGGLSGHDLSGEDMEGDGDDDDDDDDGDENGLDDDMMDKISSSPSIEDEDIDFEFVYALHTFVATVEGQANATKGDTMVLLDDSNSYWWLVRVVKDSSIGYLPAEHIETPTERLARLNKHRNIDLSATMLGDQAEKSKNPLKSAMRRRKAKTVTFAAPTYVDYTGVDYSTEEEDPEMEYYMQPQQQQQSQQQAISQLSVEGPDEVDHQTLESRLETDDEAARVQPLKTKPSKDAKIVEPSVDGSSSDGAGAKGDNRTSEEIFEASKSETPGPTRTKDGTVRDSFFKDDTVETKKITLTPNLLRDDGAPRASTDSQKELKQRPSLDRLDKDSTPSGGKEERRRKEKREKEKKPSVIRNFFSRGSKKKASDDDDESLGKHSIDMGSEGSGLGLGLEHEAEDTAEEQLSSDKATMGPTAAAAGPQRQPSKLQKQPRSEPTLTPKGSVAQKEPSSDASPLFSEPRLNVVANVPPATMRIVVDGEGQEDGDMITRAGGHGPVQAAEAARAPHSSEDTAPRALNKAAPTLSRVQDGDNTNMGTHQTPPPLNNPIQQRQRASPSDLTAALSTAGEVSSGAFQDTDRGALSSTWPADDGPPSESPVQVSPFGSSNLPPLVGDTSSQEDQSSPLSSPSPELLDGEEAMGARHRKEDSITTSTSTTTSSAWNDASLRAFFDSGSEIRDMLVVVYDNTDVPPAGPDHPVAGSLFKDENARLAEITTQLDNMLGDWLARKQRLRGTV